MTLHVGTLQHFALRAPALPRIRRPRREHVSAQADTGGTGSEEGPVLDRRPTVSARALARVRGHGFDAEGSAGQSQTRREAEVQQEQRLPSALQLCLGTGT
jgi:hypothetical protein